MRRTDRLVAGVLAGLVLLVVAAPAAHADGLTADERSEVATRATSEACAAARNGALVGLAGVAGVLVSTGLTLFDRAGTHCQEIVGAVIDPERTDTALLTDLCRKAFGESTAGDACTSALTQLLPAAQRLFLDKVAARVQELEDTLCPFTTGASDSKKASESFACQVVLVQGWFGTTVKQMWLGLETVVTTPSQATHVIDLAEPNPGADAKAFRGVYADVYVIAAGVVAVMMAWSILSAAVRRSGEPLKNAVAGALTWGLAAVSAMAVAVLVLTISDGLTTYLAGENSGKLSTALDGVTAWLTLACSGALPGFWGAGALLTLVIDLVLLVAIVLSLFTLALRDVSLVIMAVGLPVLLAMQAGPPAARKALWRVGSAFVTVALAKPMMVLGLRLGAAFMPQAAKDFTWGGLFAGIIIIGISAFSPSVLYKLFGFVESAGHRGGGAAATLSSLNQAASSTGDIAQSVFKANKAPASPGAAGGSSTAASGGPSAAGSSAGASGGGAVGGSAGGTAAAGGAAAAASIALPVVAAAAVVAAGVSTAASVASAVTSQVATGGGVLGDADSVQVASPSAPNLDQDTGRGGGDGSGRQPTAERPPDRPASPPGPAPTPDAGDPGVTGAPASPPVSSPPPPPGPPAV